MTEYGQATSQDECLHPGRISAILEPASDSRRIECGFPVASRFAHWLWSL